MRPPSPAQRMRSCPTLRSRADAFTLRCFAGLRMVPRRPCWPSKAKELRIEPKGQGQNVTLFFHTARASEGELLELDIRDVETTEQFPTGRYQADRRKRHVRPSSNGIELDDLDRLANEAFPGLVVHQGPASPDAERVQRARVRDRIPAREVLRPRPMKEAIREGPRVRARDPEQQVREARRAEAVKSAIKQHNTYGSSTRSRCGSSETHDKYWARLSNLDPDFINVEESQVRGTTAC